MAKSARPACPSRTSPRATAGEGKHCCPSTRAAEMIAFPPVGDKSARMKGEERQIQEREGCVLLTSFQHLVPVIQGFD